MSRPQPPLPPPDRNYRNGEHWQDGEEEPTSKAPIILTIIFVIVLATSFFLAYTYWYIPREQMKNETFEPQLALIYKQDTCIVEGKLGDWFYVRYKDKNGVWHSEKFPIESITILK